MYIAGIFIIDLTKGITMYRINNWKDYNKALIQRGNITFWFNNDSISNWENNVPNSVGRPYKYTDTAIIVALTLRELFKLALRSTQGLLESLKSLLKIDISVPHYTTLSKRQKSLDIKIPKITSSSKPIDIAVDSTGLKIYGEGEWKVKMHGKSKRRTWRKLHISIDLATQAIVAAKLTNARVHDTKTLTELLPANADNVYADGIYDTFEVYKKLLLNNSRPVIPPRVNASVNSKSDAASLERNNTVKASKKLGHRLWKKLSGYHKRSLVETAMSRLKRIFSGGMKNRSFQNQVVESNLRCSLINNFNTLGMPKSYKYSLDCFAC
jgi:hypothetical protein